MVRLQLFVLANSRDTVTLQHPGVDNGGVATNGVQGIGGHPKLYTQIASKGKARLRRRLPAGQLHWGEGFALGLC